MTLHFELRGRWISREGTRAQGYYEAKHLLHAKVFGQYSGFRISGFLTKVLLHSLEDPGNNSMPYVNSSKSGLNHQFKVKVCLLQESRLRLLTGPYLIIYRSNMSWRGVLVRLMASNGVNKK